jgi:hypothetical protein
MNSQASILNISTCDMGLFLHGQFPADEVALQAEASAATNVEQM